MTKGDLVRFNNIASPFRGIPAYFGVLRSERGMALILTLMIIVLITALVTEFSYDVYTTTSALNNWKNSQRLSFIAKSGMTLVVKTIPNIPADYLYQYIGKTDIPVENILEGFTGKVFITAEDENGKFNLNSLLRTNTAEKSQPYDCFVNLLRNLGLDENIAKRVADWIDRDSNPRLRDSEEGAKNRLMDSVDELLQIKGIDYQTYQKLLPYVTVYAYGADEDPPINMNTASIPVIMSICGNRTCAERIVREREKKPFDTKNASDFNRTGISLDSFYMTVGIPVNYRIRVLAEENGIKRFVETVVTIPPGGKATVKYWKEM